MKKNREKAVRRHPPSTRVVDARGEPGIRAVLDELGFAVKYFPTYVHRRVELHSVSVVLMSVIIRGRGWHHLGDEVYEEHGGSVGITHYGERHDIMTDEEGMDVMNVYLDLKWHPMPPLPREMQSVIPELLPLHPAFQNKMNKMIRIQFDDGGAEEAARLFSLERETRERQPGWREASRMLFTLFLTDCCRQALRTGIISCAREGVGAVDAMERIRRHLDANFSGNPQLSELARRVNMSGAHLCRSFKRHTGKTVFEYLVQRRIQDAMVRLRGSDEKISSIALECGFNDLSYFNRTFRRLVAMSPSRYRNP